MADMLPMPIPDAPTGPLRHMVDWVQDRFLPGTTDFTTARWIVFLAVVLGSVVLGRFGVSLLSRESGSSRRRRRIP